MGGGSSKPVNPIDAIKNAVDKAERDLKKVFVDGIKDKIVDPIEDIINDIVDEFESMIEKIENIPTFIEDIFDGIMGEIERIAQEKLDELKKPFQGIDNMIQDFQRMLCWFNTLPTRIALVMSGIDHIFQGIGEQLDLYIQAFELGVDETGTLFNYSAVFFKSYLDCIEKFIVNLYKCFFYYIVDLLLKLMYLPVILILWIFSLFGFNGYKTERRFWNTMKKVDAFFYQNLKFHILEFPESVKNDCYRCTRLRKEVVDYQGNRLDYVFNEEMPKIVNGENSKKGLHTMKKGQRHFHEVNEYNPRNPNKVD